MKKNRNILIGKKAKKEIVSGMNILSEIIGSTIGPRGRNVIIDSGIDYPLITNDGASIAKEIFLTSPFEDIGLNILKEASLKTNEIVGDGTTTAIVLASSILKNGKKYLKKGKNVNLLKDNLENINEEISEYLDKISKKVTSSEEIKNLAYISSGNLKHANILKEIYEKGSINSCFIAEDTAEETSFSIDEGIYLETGYISEYLNSEGKLFKDISNPYLLFYDGSFESIKNIIHILEKIKDEKENIVIIAKDFSKEAKKSIIYNNVNNILNIYAVKMPEYFEMTKDFFKDLALNLKTNIYTSEEELLNLSIEDLVKAKNIKISKDKTYIFKNENNSEKTLKKDVEDSKKNILKQIQKEKDKSKKERLKKRLAIYESKIAIVKIGSQTDAEKKNARLKFEDALATCISSLKEGVLEGGGLAFLKLSSFLDDKIKKIDKKEFKTKEEYKIRKDALKILSKSLKAPFEKIVKNTGKKPKKVLKEIIKNEYKYGFNAENFTYVNMFDEGIIDSKLGQKTALKTAISVSSMILTMSSVIYKDLDYEI